MLYIFIFYALYFIVRTIQLNLGLAGGIDAVEVSISELVIVSRIQFCWVLTLFYCEIRFSVLEGTKFEKPNVSI